MDEIKFKVGSMAGLKQRLEKIADDAQGFLDFAIGYNQDVYRSMTWEEVEAELKKQGIKIDKAKISVHCHYEEVHVSIC